MFNRKESHPDFPPRSIAKTPAMCLRSLQRGKNRVENPVKVQQGRLKGKERMLKRDAARVVSWVVMSIFCVLKAWVAWMNEESRVWRFL